MYKSKKGFSALNFVIFFRQAKEGGRGVKTVYKGIKSKIKDAKVPGHFRNSTSVSDADIRINSASSSPETSRKSIDDESSSNDNRPVSLEPSPNPSRSSSGMNILQELEREGLFYRPEINKNVRLIQFFALILPISTF